MMKKLFVSVITCFVLINVHGQVQDTTAIDTVLLRKDRQFEMCISIVAPGAGWYTSELSSSIRDNGSLFANMFYLQFNPNRFTINGVVSLGGIKMKDTVVFENKNWTEIASSFYGLTCGYTVLDKRRIKLKPYAGITSSSFYYPHNGVEGLEQKSKTTANILLGASFEYRFLFKKLWTHTPDPGKIEWAEQSWSVYINSGMVPSVFKRNIGLRGDMIFLTIGGSFNIGNYTHFKSDRSQ